MKVLKAVPALLFFSLACFGVLAEKVLPTEFSNNRITLVPKLLDGTKLKFYSDTGGGFNAIARELQQQYAWPEIKKNTGKEEVTLTPMPKFQPDASIPLAGLNNFMEGHLFVVPQAELRGLGPRLNGFLGGRWHAEKIVRFDYPGKSMSILDGIHELDTTGFNKVKLGFQKDHNNNYTMAFPRMEIEVSGRKHQMLFDTGATSILTEAAIKQTKNTGKLFGTSFMAASVFDQWRVQNPDWLVVEKGEAYSGSSLIRVPVISIAGQEVGPVWFTRREDNNFHDYMSSMMDEQIDGALGGSGLQYFEIVVDYPGERAYFKAKG